MNPKAIPLALYIHIPWCVRKCPYCDFNSHQKNATLDEAAYIAHLLRDFAYDYAGETRPLTSIFIGGGTPSLFSGESIAQLLHGIRDIADFAPEIEITLEANPSTAEQANFAAYHHAGVNRLSLGIQSFNPKELRTLGRIHSAEEAHLAIEMAQTAGFMRLNTDLMFALPQQSVAMALEDLQQAIHHNAEHLSWYQLTLEPNTPFYTHPPKLPDDEAQIDIYLAGCEVLTAAGFRQYETSAWTRGKPAKHNLNYWQFGDYIGIGAGAHGKRTLPSGEIIRRSKYRAPAVYQAARGKAANPYQDTQKTVAPSDQAFEFMMNALRLKAGVASELLTERTALTLDAIAPIWARLEKEGLVTPLGAHLQTTPRGFAMLNDVLEAFLP